MDMARYFVTNAGLAAAFGDRRVLETLTNVLHGDAPKPLVQDLLRQGLIDEEHRDRPAQIDHNLLLLSGALDRLRDVLPEAPKKKNGHANSALDDEAIRDLRTVPKKLYRLSSKAGKITSDELRQLSSGARRVLVALRNENVGTTKTLAEHTGLSRRTVENALSVLRKARLLDTVDFESGR